MIEPIGRVVVIEDEQSVRDAVIAALRTERFTATAFEAGDYPERLSLPWRLA